LDREPPKTFRCQKLDRSYHIGYKRYQKVKQRRFHTMTKTGRPGIGNYVNVPVGDLLDQIDRWATNHGIKRNAAIRDLIRLGLEHSGSDERVLIEGGDL